MKFFNIFQAAVLFFFYHTIISQTVDYVELINSNSNTEVFQLTDNVDIIDLSQTQNINFRAKTNPDPLTSGNCGFELTPDGGSPYTHSEGESPYALFGDNSGNYNDWSGLPQSEGEYTLVVTPAGGTIYTTRFEIINSDDTTAPETVVFNKKDFISLHYDHAPDPDDCHSAAADRSMLQTLFGVDWFFRHIAAVSGTYGKNVNTFREETDNVMVAVWDEKGGPGWLAAHPWDENLESVVDELTEKWMYIINKGDHIWVKEGGQSDITARVVEKIQQDFPYVDTNKVIHVIQHSNWNEGQTTDQDLAYTKANTDYDKIDDANMYLNVVGGNTAFETSALNHPIFGSMWQSAFDYYDPQAQRLDFSDTGELMYILGLGKMSIDEFKQNYLDYDCNPTCGDRKYCSQSQCECIEGWNGNCDDPQCTSCNSTSEYCAAPETCWCQDDWLGYACDFFNGTLNNDGNNDLTNQTVITVISVLIAVCVVFAIVGLIIAVILIILFIKRKKGTKEKEIDLDSQESGNDESGNDESQDSYSD